MSCLCERTRQVVQLSVFSMEGLTAFQFTLTVPELFPVSFAYWCSFSREQPHNLPQPSTTGLTKAAPISTVCWLVDDDAASHRERLNGTMPGNPIRIIPDIHTTNRNSRARAPMRAPLSVLYLSHLRTVARLSLCHHFFSRKVGSGSSPKGDETSVARSRAGDRSSYAKCSSLRTLPEIGVSPDSRRGLP